MKPKELAALMGALVVVDKQLVRDEAWESQPLTDHRTGWIVGITRLQQGVRCPGSPGGWFGDDYAESEPPYFEQTGPTIPALLVCFWPNQRPVRVPLDGWRLATPDDPKPHVGAFKWDEASKEQQREIMRAHWRDAQGRWIKGGYKPEGGSQ